MINLGLITFVEVLRQEDWYHLGSIFSKPRLVVILAP